MPGSRPLPNLRVQFGPLRYLVQAYDSRSQEVLELMQRHLAVVPFAGPPGRVIHLLEHHSVADDFERMSQSRLPEALQHLVAEDLPESNWWSPSDDLGYVYHVHPGSLHGFWTFDPQWSNMPSVYQIPWAFLFYDLISWPGAIAHAGLAVRDGQGWLFTAPPDGGKSTALSRLPAPWTTLSDDAALIWFDASGALWASPLPTWSVILGRGSLLPADHRLAVATAVPVAEAVLLQKAPCDRVVSVATIDAAPALYRALCEHPAVLDLRQSHLAALFHCACEVARSVGAWRLELTRDGSFWEILGEVR